MIDLDELERLCREAESGEWRTHGPSKPQPDAPEGGDFAIICGSDIIAETFYRSGYETTHNARANAELIAALRNAAPELIAMARRYQWGVKNARWLRHEHEAYVAIPVALDADLSCEATRHAAIDDAMKEKP